MRFVAGLCVTVFLAACAVQCGDPTPVESEPFRVCVQERLAKLVIKTTVTSADGRLTGDMMTIDRPAAVAKVTYEGPATLDIRGCSSRPSGLADEIPVAMSRPEWLSERIQVLPNVWLNPLGGRSDLRLDTSPADHFLVHLGPGLVSARAGAPARIELMIRVGFKLTAALPGQAAVSTRTDGEGRVADPTREHRFSLPAVGVPHLLELHGSAGPGLVVLDPENSAGFSPDRETLRKQLQDKVTTHLAAAPGPLGAALLEVDRILARPDTVVVARTQIADLGTLSADDRAESLVLIGNSSAGARLYTDTGMRGAVLNVQPAGYWCAWVPDLDVEHGMFSSNKCGMASADSSSSPAPSFARAISSLAFQP